jgi:hypothetical protein
MRMLFHRIVWRLVAFVILPAYILYRRGVRRVEWFFLVKAMLKRRTLIRALIKSVESAFAHGEGFDHVSAVLYFSRGYGLTEAVDGRGTFYWEAPLGIAVWTEEGPLVGMAVEFRGDALCIRQLQGVAGARIPKSLLHWPRLFVEACISCAEGVGMREVRIYKADQSLFYYFPTMQLKEGEDSREATRAHRKRMRRRYEGTARQLSFCERSNWYVWKVQD